MECGRLRSTGRRDNGTILALIPYSGRVRMSRWLTLGRP
jgi:hypothetical protein